MIFTYEHSNKNQLLLGAKGLIWCNKMNFPVLRCIVLFCTLLNCNILYCDVIQCMYTVSTFSNNTICCEVILFVLKILMIKKHLKLYYFCPQCNRPLQAVIERIIYNRMNMERWKNMWKYIHVKVYTYICIHRCFRIEDNYGTNNQLMNK